MNGKTTSIVMVETYDKNWYKDEEKLSKSALNIKSSTINITTYVMNQYKWII